MSSDSVMTIDRSGMDLFNPFVKVIELMITGKYAAALEENKRATSALDREIKVMQDTLSDLHKLAKTSSKIQQALAFMKQIAENNGRDQPELPY